MKLHVPNERPVACIFIFLTQAMHCSKLCHGYLLEISHWCWNFTLVMKAVAVSNKGFCCAKLNIYNKGGQPYGVHHEAGLFLVDDQD